MTTQQNSICPHDSLFTFVPPADAQLISAFPDPRDSYGGPTMAGGPIPPLKFKSADGKIIPIESYLGKPVLIDFWATWCGPCVAALPKLAQLYRETQSKGLVLFSVDRDEEADKAAEFLSKKGYTWPDYHDSDAVIEKQVGSSSIPRTVLVDAHGNVVFDGNMNEDRLREELSKMGPDYASVKAKPQSTPCVASR